MKAAEDAGSLDELRLLCQDCQRCGLAATRRSVVFGEGDRRAKLFLLGEAPGRQEDECGRPFVGRAGDVLNQLLARAGLERDDIFITGSAKCRPPGNRNPRRAELKACRSYLDRQLELVQPRVVVCLGLVAVQNILDPRAKMSGVRGCWFDGPGYRILPTYHPAAVLRGTASAEMLVEDFLAAAKALR